MDSERGVVDAVGVVNGIQNTRCFVVVVVCFVFVVCFFFNLAVKERHIGR